MENQSVKIVFNEFQTDLLIDFFSDLEKLKFKNRNNKTISINPNKHDGSWVFDMDPYVPAINEAFSQNLGKLKNFDRLIEGLGSSNLYPIVKSKSLITDCMEKLSQKYGLAKIPLIYTTVLFPSKDNLPALVWAELSSVGCFEEKDFGHVDFIKAIIKLQEEKIIKIKSFEIMCLDGMGFTSKITADYLKLAKVKGGKEVNEIKGISKIVTKRGEDFYYKGDLINFGEGTIYRDIFDILYYNTAQEDFLSYEQIDSDLVRRGHGEVSPKKIKKRIQNNIENGIFRFAKLNGKRFKNVASKDTKLIQFVRGRGIKFNNFT